MSQLMSNYPRTAEHPWTRPTAQYTTLGLPSPQRVCNLMVRFSKFTYDKMIVAKLEEFLSKLIWTETFSFFKCLSYTRLLKKLSVYFL